MKQCSAYCEDGRLITIDNRYGYSAADKNFAINFYWYDAMEQQHTITYIIDVDEAGFTNTYLACLGTITDNANGI